MSQDKLIPVVVNGAAGKMGKEVIKAIAASEDMMLVGAVDQNPAVMGADVGEIAGCGELEIPITNDLQSILVLATQYKIQGVMVDFTHPDSVYENVRTAIAYGVRPVIGTTGLSPEQIQDLAEFAEKSSTGVLIIPNFSIGVVLMQQAAIRAAQYFEHVEIIELHHNQKADAPSGTAIKTAKMLSDLGKTYNPQLVEEKEHLAGARGSVCGDNIRIHSVRFPAPLAPTIPIFS